MPNGARVSRASIFTEENIIFPIPMHIHGVGSEPSRIPPVHFAPDKTSTRLVPSSHPVPLNQGTIWRARVHGCTGVIYWGGGDWPFCSSSSITFFLRSRALGCAGCWNLKSQDYRLPVTHTRTINWPCVIRTAQSPVFVCCVVYCQCIYAWPLCVRSLDLSKAFFLIPR